MKKIKYLYFRRSVQAFILLIIVSAAFLNLWKIDLIQGTLCSIGTKSVDITCSLGAIQTMIASREIHLPLIVSASFFLLLAMILGRVFCSWVCPHHIASEIGDKAGALFRKSKNISDSIKHYSQGRLLIFSILFLGLTSAFIFKVPIICYICPIGIICRNILNLTHFSFIGKELIIILIIVMIEITVARRGWCKYICPVGGLYSLLILRRSLHIRRNHTQCRGCEKCEDTCPMGNSPLHGKIGKTCTNCAICIDTCPEGALSFRVGE